MLVQFLGQAVGLVVLRHRIKKGTMPEDEEAFKVKCLPLVVMIQMTTSLPSRPVAISLSTLAAIHATLDQWTG